MLPVKGDFAGRSVVTAMVLSVANGILIRMSEGALGVMSVVVANRGLIGPALCHVVSV